jgi:hypothetical protein
MKDERRTTLSITLVPLEGAVENTTTPEDVREQDTPP